MGIRSFFRNRRTNSIDKKAIQLAEAGNTRLAQELENAKEALEYATYRYERLEDRYGYSEDRKEKLEEKLSDYKQAKKEMRGFPFPLLLKRLRDAFWRTGLTKKGREFKKLERKIRTAERTLNRMERNGTRQWEEIMVAEEEMEKAEANLQEVEKAILEEYKAKKTEIRDGEFKQIDVEEKDEEAKEEVRQEEEKEEEEKRQEDNKEEEKEENENIEKDDMSEAIESLEAEKEKILKNINNEKDAKIRKEMESDLQKIEKELNEKMSQKNKTNDFKESLRDPSKIAFVDTNISRDDLEKALANTTTRNPEEFLRRLGKTANTQEEEKTISIGEGKSNNENYLKEGIAILERMSSEDAVPQNKAERIAKELINNNPEIVKSYSEKEIEQEQISELGR